MGVESLRKIFRSYVDRVASICFIINLANQIYNKYRLITKYALNKPCEPIIFYIFKIHF